EYWSSLEVVHSRFLEFFALTHPSCSTTPRDIYDWLQQIEEEQYWSELYEWSLNCHTALVSMSNTLQTPNEEQVQSYDGSLFVDSSSTSARAENGSGGKKYYYSSPEKWTRPASFAFSRKAPSLGSSQSGYDSPIESVGYWARNSPFTMFEDLLTERSHTTMLSPLTAAGNLPSFDEPYCSSPSSTSAESEHIPRPPNAFLIFRSDYCQKHKGERRVQGNISKITGLSVTLIHNIFNLIICQQAPRGNPSLPQRYTIGKKRRRRRLKGISLNT